MRTLLLLAAALALAAPAVAQLPVEAHPQPQELLPSDDPVLAANKKLVFDFWREVLQAHHVDRAPRVSRRRLHPAQPERRDRPRRIHGVLRPIAAGAGQGDDRRSRPHRRGSATSSCSAFRRELPDLAREGQTYTTTWFDMFRIADGKIVEHWDYGTKE